MRPTYTSDLEREFEEQLEAEGPDPSSEAENAEFELFAEGEGDPELEADQEWSDREWEADPGSERFVEQLRELEARGFESEAEIDQRLGEILQEMEREYFFKGLGRRLRKAGRSLVKHATKMARGLPAFKAFNLVTQAARDALKGNLRGLAKTALASGLIPGGAVALPVMNALGFEAEHEHGGAQRVPWHQYVHVAREAYAELADRLHEGVTSPAEASRVAGAAYAAAHAKAGAGGGRSGPRRRRITLRPGEVVILRVGS